MNTKRLTQIILTFFLLYTLHITHYTSIASAATKGNPPVGHWKFDEGGGATAYDESANNNDGTLTPGVAGTNTNAGQMWSRQGKIGSALELDGTDDWVDIPDYNPNGSDFTISAWVTLTASGSDYYPIFGNYQNTPMLGYDPPNNQFVTLVQDTSSSETISWSYTDLENTGWHHVALSVQDTSSSMILYVDGKSLGQKAMTLNYTHGNGALRGLGNDYASYWAGLMDDARLYNYSRTAEQVLMDFNAGAASRVGAGTDPNEGSPPVGYWPLDENTGTTAYDRSGNGYNGTWVGTSSYTAGKYGSAASFAGVAGTYVSLPVQTYSSSSFTMSIWLNILGTTGTYQTPFLIYSGSRNCQINLSTTGYIGYYLRDSTGTIVDNYTSTINAWGTGWHHVAATLDKNGSTCTAKLYIDGVNVRTQVNTATGTFLDNIGGYISYGISEPVKGYLDEVKIYNYARSAAQIAYDYNRGKPVAHYKFDEGAGTIAHNEYSTADTGAAPMGWWRMDNSWNDSSGNANNGTASGATFSASSKIGPYCGSFNGTNNYVSLAKYATSNFTNGITISGWLKVNGVTTSDSQDEMSPVGQGRGFIWGYTYQSSGLLSFYIRANNAWQSVSVLNTYTRTYLSTAGWIHLAGTYDNSVLKIYINGVLNNSATINQNITIQSDASDGLNIGGRNESSINQDWFNGSVDDLRIYNYSRTAEQIYNDYKTTQGTLVGDTKFVDGKIGKALQFDGTGDYVDCGSDAVLNPASGITIESWVKISSFTGNWMSIVDRRTSGNLGGYILDITPSDHKANLYVYTTGWDNQTGNTTLVSGVWYHIAGVFDGSQKKVYVNGVLDGSGNLSGALGSTPAKTYIGGSVEYGDQFFNGLIDDVRIYNYARSAEQILQDFNAGMAGRVGAQSAGELDPWGGAMPVAWWKMDENTGKLAYDASGNGNNGTLTGSTSWSQGRLGSCVNFAGDNTSYVLVPHSSTLTVTSAFTFEAWIYQNTASGGIIFNKEVSYEWMGGSTIQWAIANTTPGWTWINTGITITNGVWEHYAMVYDGSSVKTYKNGVLGHTLAASGNLADPGNTFRIGDRQSGPQPFNGKIDDVRVYNYGRTPAQIAWDYNRGKPVGHWRFNEGSGTTAYDESDNNNDGTITIGATGTQTTIASAWTNGATGKFGKCMSFDGTDDYVSVANEANFDFERTNSFSISGWINPANMATTYKSIVTKMTNSWVGYTFYISYSTETSNPSALGFILSNTNVSNDIVVYTPNNSIATGWQYVCVTYSGTSNVSGVKMYINGKEQTLSTVRNGLSASMLNNNNLEIGHQGVTAWPEWFVGLIDDVRVYNYVRTPEQILQDYNNGMAARMGD